MLYYSVTSSALFPSSLKSWEFDSTIDLSQINFPENIRYPTRNLIYTSVIGITNALPGTFTWNHTKDEVSPASMSFVISSAWWCHQQIPHHQSHYSLCQKLCSSELPTLAAFKVSPKAAMHISSTEKTIS